MSDETIINPPANENTPDDDDLNILKTHLSPKYTVERKLGSGGMADVYLGYHNQLKRRIAIKVLPRAMSRDEGMVKRFLKEAESAAQLSHPNIINIYDIGVAAPLNFFIMAFISGGSLKDQLRTGTVSIERATDIIVQICGALHYAHTMGVIHRDIKPDNIMFDEHGNAILMDFGIAKAKFASKLTATGTLIGTPHYMSPEQLKGKELDGRSDIYSLGILFYEILTGKVPFEGDDTYAIGLKHIQEPPVPPLELNPSIPEALNNIILTMLAKTPEARFTNAEDVASAITDVLAGKEFDVTKARTAVETWSGDKQRLDETLVDEPLGKTVVRSDDHLGNVAETVVSPGRPGSTSGKKGNALLWIIVAIIAIGAISAGVFFALPYFSNTETSSDNERESRKKKDRDERKNEAEANLFENGNLLYTVEEKGIVHVYLISDTDGKQVEFFKDQELIGKEAKDFAYSPQTKIFIIEDSGGSLMATNEAGYDSSLVYFDESGGNEGPKMASFTDDGLRLCFTRIKDNKSDLLVADISATGIPGEPVVLHQSEKLILFPLFVPETDNMIIYAQFDRELYSSTFFMIKTGEEDSDEGFVLEGEIIDYDISNLGESLACLMLDGGEKRIDIVSEDEDDGRTIFESEKIGRSIIYSPDGEYVIFSMESDENTWDVYAIAVAGGDPFKITDFATSKEIFPVSCFGKLEKAE